ncbi:MAG TPA: sigma-70 family RNA polymerase sigma factor, partial [Solirubrobacteraceae bacterium]|nr:sigma-70 family RNA polymerase sigma factor [Solirubrobacteraceae bacterium]
RTSAVRIPRELQRMSGALRRKGGELEAKLGRSPTVPELAAAIAADEKDVERALDAERARGASAASRGDVGGEAADETEPLAGSEDRLLLARGVKVLDERERRIVFLRFHADMTERQIASTVGISQAHVSRLLEGALAKLREELANTPADITRAPVISPQSATKSPVNAGNSRGRTDDQTKIAAVGEEQENPALVRYLELPYHFAVRREHHGKQLWWSARVEELPGCEARGATADEALAQLRGAMRDWLTSALAERREIPPPSPEAPKAKAGSSHSGRILVRMPTTLHEQLARAAEREQVSLNRLVTDTLAASVASSPPVEKPGGSTPGPPVTLEPPRAQGGAPRALRVALATNLAVVVVAGLIALALLVLALQRGI